ncbi:hypothetical protein I79_001992 [Cricetulus griseus]|uniref:Uncharacterized protein n=1 Tax=Cricetulus griseus TaxID=10029 RepID=G3GW75_CRIGR|nr:hypothetical protein I79_001992 [Cricetulus griseus]
MNTYLKELTSDSVKSCLFVHEKVYSTCRPYILVAKPEFCRQQIPISPALKLWPNRDALAQSQ